MCCIDLLLQTDRSPVEKHKRVGIGIIIGEKYIITNSFPVLI